MIFCIHVISLFIARVCFPANDYIFCPGPFLRGNHVHPCGPWYGSKSHTTVDFFSAIFTFCSSFCQVIASSPESPGRGVTPPCLLAATLSQKERRKIENREIYLLIKRNIELVKGELVWSRSISVDFRAHKHLQLWQGNQGHYQSPEMRAWSFQSKKSKGELLS